MEKTTFLLLFIVWIFLFAIKGPILNSLHKQNILVAITQKGVNYIFLLLFIVLMVVGVLFTSSAESNFDNVSSGFENYRSQNSEDKKPHRYFDINFELIFGKGND